VADDIADQGRRGRLRKFIVGHYSTRLHMSLILMCCGLTAMITSWFLLHYGVHSMLVRYPIAMTLAYGTFLIGVWTWLRATGLSSGAAPQEPANASKAKSKSSLGDLVDIPSGGSSSGGGGGGGGFGSIFRGAGGKFDGGGASASFAEARVPVAVPVVQADVAAAATPAKSGGGSSSSSSFGSKGGSSLFDGIDGDGAILLILAAILVLVVFGTSGYLIYSAPDVLTEAAFGASLTGVLSRPSANHAAGGWVEGVIRKTCWPFGIVMVAALAFAGWCELKYPGASTFREAIWFAVHSNA
jgi:hypothetical protein